METGLLAVFERIDHQNDDFGKRLEALVAQLAEDIRTNGWEKKNLNDYPIVKKIERLIFLRLGITVCIVTNSHMAAIMPFYSNKNHIFLNNYLRGNINLRDQNKILATFKEKTGWVDTKAAKVGGLFSEYKHSMYINFGEMISSLDLTPAEIVGAMLHELGHAFEACYYADRSDTTNQVLSSIFRAITDPEANTKVEYIFKEVEKITDRVTKEEIDNILHGPRVVAGVAWFKAVVKIVQSQTKNDKYNETAFEEAADSFAGRFGYGAQLTLTLEKIHADGLYKRNSVLVFAYMMDFAVIGLYAGIILAAISVGSVPLLVMAAVSNLAMLSMSGEDSLDYTYDTLKNRYKRIRQDTVDRLKDNTLSKEEIKNVLESVYAMDEAIKTTNEYRSVYSRVANLVFSSSRDALENINAQQLMETLASNELFVNAAELKQHV